MRGCSAAKAKMGVEDYVMQEKLGKGAFATVYKIQRKVDNSVYACKKIDISKMQKNEISADSRRRR